MSYHLISDESRKARKQHRCSWCGQTISIGEQYRYIRCIYDGAPQSNKFHPECDNAVSEAAREEGGEFEFTPGEGQRPTIGAEREEAASTAEQCS